MPLPNNSHHDVLQASNTKDLVQKKMVYHYLCNYAAQKSDLAILAINTLQKDCRDEDPMTRGLALRSLCSLRLDNVVEYTLLPIRKGLNDGSPYVRKTAVIGCAKLFRQAPEAVKGSDLVDILYNMLKDKDTHVITNVLNALNEILAAEGGMVREFSVCFSCLCQASQCVFFVWHEAFLEWRSFPRLCMLISKRRCILLGDFTCIICMHRFSTARSSNIC